MSHTPTPWNYEIGDCAIYEVETAGIIARFEEADVEAHADDNAAHIVKCVNAWDDANALRARLAELT